MFLFVSYFDIFACKMLKYRGRTQIIRCISLWLMLVSIRTMVCDPKRFNFEFERSVHRAHVYGSGLVFGYHFRCSLWLRKGCSSTRGRKSQRMSSVAGGQKTRTKGRGCPQGRGEECPQICLDTAHGCRRGDRVGYCGEAQNQIERIEVI